MSQDEDEPGAGLLHRFRGLLERIDDKVGEIAAALGYADTSAFGRAFRRWCDETPARWRARAASRAAPTG